MDNLHDMLGHGENLTPFQMSFRAAIVFVFALILIRIGGVRIFGRRSSVDTIIVIVMGSVLARGIVGASPLLSVLAASAIMILLHKLFSWLSSRFNKFESLVKSKRIILYQNGQINNSNLVKAGLSKNDLLESLHLESKQRDLEGISTVYLETNGRISFIQKT
jgi:uncharacterized membrane protein YcaP (DUF421 family)